MWRLSPTCLTLSFLESDSPRRSKVRQGGSMVNINAGPRVGHRLRGQCFAPILILSSWWPANGSAPKGKVLVVGSGLGDDAAWFNSKGLEVIGFDVSPTATAVARRRFPNKGLSFVTANGGELPFARDSFSFVLESYTLQCLERRSRRAVMAEAASVLSPEGKCWS